MKCEVTGKDIEKTFLGKILGTVVKDEKGKKHFVSAAVQTQYKNNKSEILKQIKNR